MPRVGPGAVDAVRVGSVPVVRRDRAAKPVSACDRPRKITPRRKGVRREFWNVRVYPDIGPKVEQVMARTGENRSQLLRRYIVEGLNRDLAGPA